MADFTLKWPSIGSQSVLSSGLHHRRVPAPPQAASEPQAPDPAGHALLRDAVRQVRPHAQLQGDDTSGGAGRHMGGGEIFLLTLKTKENK